MDIKTFLSNYSLSDKNFKYLKASFPNWCIQNNIKHKNSIEEWKNIFECDYAKMRVKTPVYIVPVPEEIVRIQPKIETPIVPEKNDKKRGKR